MKKISWLFAAALPLVILFSCQKSLVGSDEASANRQVSPLANAQPVISFSASPAPVGQPVTLSVEYGSCGGGLLQVYNTKTGIWDQLVGNTNASASNPDFTFTFTPSADSVNDPSGHDYTFRVVTTGGQNCTAYVGPSSSFYLDVVSSCTIEGNEFTGVAGAGSCGTSRSATYTFGSEDGLSYFKMQGGLNNFTGADAAVSINGTAVTFVDGVGAVNGYTVKQWTPGGSSNRVISVEGGLGECSDVVVVVNWGTSNGGTTITGAWSVKDANSVDLAAPVADLTCVQ